ncbi:hypothetical protein QTP88_000640 [Uroleucon formosanum]
MNQTSQKSTQNGSKIEPDDWRTYLRMDEDTYIELLNLVTPLVKKQNTVIRTAITPQERLSTTLRFLATGRSMQDLKYSVAIYPQSLGQIIPETCTAICKVLRRDYLKFPNSEDECKEISRKFETIWNFPHCLGAVGHKHLSIACPPKSGSFYYNYK